MYEVRFIFLYHPAARYKVPVPKDPKQAAISGSRCFVIHVIYGVRFRLERRIVAQPWTNAWDGVANDKNRIRRSERLHDRAAMYLGASLDVSRLVLDSFDALLRAAAGGPDFPDGRATPLRRFQFGMSKSSLEKQRNELRCRP